MLNPWLSVSLEDYERHMSSEGVRQLDPLADFFGRALDLCTPESVAILGVAGGNGLVRIDAAITKRIVGLDINPRYIEAVRRRYAGLPGLELCCADLAGAPVACAPVALVHAALVFEHTGLGRALENSLRLVARGGKLSVILQLPGKAGDDVAPTHFSSMQALRRSFALVDVLRFRVQLEERGFHLFHEERRSLPAGKAFWLGIFDRRPG